MGDIRYTRTFTFPPGVAGAIRAGNAVIVVHGIDYNGNGIYDDVLDRSELNHNLPGEATAPALCGPLVATQTAATTGQGPSAERRTRSYSGRRASGGDARDQLRTALPPGRQSTLSGQRSTATDGTPT